MVQTEIEGLWEDLVKRNDFSGRRVRVSVLPAVVDPMYETDPAKRMAIREEMQSSPKHAAPGGTYSREELYDDDGR